VFSSNSHISFGLYNPGAAPEEVDHSMKDEYLYGYISGISRETPVVHAGTVRRMFSLEVPSIATPKIRSETVPIPKYKPGIEVIISTLDNEGHIREIQGALNLLLTSKQKKRVLVISIDTDRESYPRVFNQALFITGRLDAPTITALGYILPHIHTISSIEEINDVVELLHEKIMQSPKAQAQLDVLERNAHRTGAEHFMLIAGTNAKKLSKHDTREARSD
jgi:hypothetical protein